VGPALIFAAVLLGLAPAVTLASGAPGNAQAGEQAFAVCRACHSTAPGAPAVIGPNLNGVVGRRVASAAGFDYSEALRGVGGSWDRERIDRFLTDPLAFAPGTKMGFVGIADPVERADVIAYLESLGSAPASAAPAAPAVDFGPDWPAGPGQLETGTQCNACHSLALVKQQKLTRDRWDQLLSWMVSEQGMPEPDPARRELMLEYLATHFGRPGR
jgi:cytochrome c